MTRVITVASGKGGVGKSTVAGKGLTRNYDSNADDSEPGIELAADEWRQSRADSQGRTSGSGYLWAIGAQADGSGGSRARHVIR